MKIGITCYPTYGGSGVVATELGIELAARGHQVHFITYSQPFRLTGREEGIFYHEVPVSNYPLFEYPPYDLALATRMSEVAEYYELDLLHVHYAIPHSVCALLARQMLAKSAGICPLSPRCTAPTSPWWGSTARICPSPASASKRAMASPPSPITCEKKPCTTSASCGPSKSFPTSSTATNTNPWATGGEDARARYADPGEKILLHLSNFRPVKRILDVIEVFSRVAQVMPARLLMVGDGPDRSSAEWLVNSKGIQNRVHFLGKQERVHELLPVADLMLMPSELESFGLAALEAMACKVPTIATRVGGVPELIEDGVTGRLFAVGDVDAMAAAAIELLTDDARLNAMADAGRRAAQDHYCASRIIPVYEQYYERVLARAEV